MSALGVARIRQVKLPVNDLRTSTDWYRRALDLELAVPGAPSVEGLDVFALDPDGIHVRFLCGNPIGQGGFHGFDFTDAGPAVYDVPRSL